MEHDSNDHRIAAPARLSLIPRGSPPPQLDTRLRLESRASPEYQSRRNAWRAAQWKTQRENPVLRTAYGGPAPPPEVVQLLSQGIQLSLDPGTYPAGSTYSDVINLAAIARAFSRMFGPILFQELGKDGPPAALFWNDLFSFTVDVQKSGSTLCLGVDGAYQDGGFMSILDCADESEVFHEIGHAVMDSGILKQRAPLYFHYSVGGPVPVGGQAPVVDSLEWLQMFGKPAGTDLDIDGVPIGFVSTYASGEDVSTHNKPREDFAETYKWYVYFPSALWQKVDRQLAQGSNVLSLKAGLIAALYAGLWFNDNGVPGGWPGYSL